MLSVLGRRATLPFTLTTVSAGWCFLEDRGRGHGEAVRTVGGAMVGEVCSPIMVYQTRCLECGSREEVGYLLLPGQAGSQSRGPTFWQASLVARTSLGWKFTRRMLPRPEARCKWSKAMELHSTLHIATSGLDSGCASSQWGVWMVTGTIRTAACGCRQGDPARVDQVCVPIPLFGVRDLESLGHVIEQTGHDVYHSLDVFAVTDSRTTCSSECMSLLHLSQITGHCEPYLNRQRKGRPAQDSIFEQGMRILAYLDPPTRSESPSIRQLTPHRHPSSGRRVRFHDLDTLQE